MGCSSSKSLAVSGGGGYGYRPRAPSRFQLSCGAACHFIKETFGSQDGYGFACFSQSFFSYDWWYGNGKVNAMRALQDVVQRMQCANGTALYDSIECAIREFSRPNRGSRDRPWVLIILTDGQDTHSQHSRDSIARFIRDTYNRASDNFCFLVGVGPAHEVDMASLNYIARNSGSQAVYVADFQLLEVAFALLAVRIVAGEEVYARLSHEKDAARIYAVVHQYVRAQRQPIDVMFVLDISGSMAAPAL